MRKQLSPGWLLTILTGLNLLNYLDRFVLNAVRTPLAEDFKIGYGDSGRTVTAFMIGYFVTSPFFGYLGDRFSRKWLIALGILIWSLGTFLTGFATGFAVLLMFRVLVGLGEASYATISPSLISDAFSTTRRNNALTIFYVAIPVGAALGYLVGGEISTHWGWRHAFIWAGAPGFVLALILLPFEEPRRGQADLAETQAVSKPGLKDYLNLVGNGNYQLVVWGYVALTFALGAFGFWGPTFLEKVHHLSTARADRFFGLVLVVAGLVGTLAGGFAATAWRKRNPAGYAWLLGTSVLAAVPTSLMAFLCHSTDLTLAFLALSMFLLFLPTGPINTLIIESVPLNLRASAMALSIFMIHLFGDMWSPEIVGRLADAWGDLRKAVMILPGALLVAGLFWLGLAAKMVLSSPGGATSGKGGGSVARWALRTVLWTLTHIFYRLRILGLENVPEKGGALIVCNHLSHVDALLLLASSKREIRFMMYKGIYEKPFVKPLASVMGVIPISSEQRPREMIQSLRDASEAIQNGELVCIFAEGQITRIGQLLPFRRGFERIMKDVEAPIIPVALEGVWGSIFSFQKGRFLWKVPRRIPYPITVSFGKPMPHTATPFEVRYAVQELMTEAWKYRRTWMQTLHRAFLHTARWHPFRFAMADAQSRSVSFGSARARTLFLAGRLRKVWSGQRFVGLLLPPSVPGALVNYAAMLMGKVPVNLNYTVSEGTLGSCIQQCGIKTVVTSKTFLEKVKLKVPCDTVFLEEVAARPGMFEKVKALLVGWLLPCAVIERLFCGVGLGKRPTPGTETLERPAIVEGSEADRHEHISAPGDGRTPGLEDLATIIFSSGSTGEPKGVMLSHYNIGSNIEQMDQVFGLDKHDRILGILPFFHSFGFTGTLWLPAVLGAGVVYHANPLDAKTIGPLVNEYRLTFLLATPTFLQLYIRGCAAEDFGSLRLVMTGAEKLPDRLALAFEEHFGIRPLEGYGCTECAPVVAVNTFDFRSAGFRQVGGKRGKIGHPVPGVSARIVDIESSAAVGMGQAGLLLVRGPNVMRGYLGRPEKTAEVLRDGWYVTGDVAAIDEDGFLQITDRLNRFSKIGGEMVPHIKVEEKLHELAGATEQTFVVTGVPDEKKGERLVVLHKMAEDRRQEVMDKLAQSDLPNLWKPKAEQFFKVEAFPYLGTGKLDLRKVKDVAVGVSGKGEG